VKLALVCRPFSFHGGVETATAGLLRELVRRGYAVDLLSTAAQADVPGVTVRRLPSLSHPSLLRLLSFAVAARRALRGRDYDVVQSHERGLCQDVYRAGEGTHRGYLAAMGRRRAASRPYHAAVLALERRIFTLRAARHVVAISRRDRAEIVSLYDTPPDRVSLVYNGVDQARFHPDNRARFGAATRQSLGVDAGAWVVLFAGSGFERKGLGPLLEGVARLPDRRWRLLVAGKGRAEPYRLQAARLEIERQVLWLGARPDIDRLYAAADVVALPARYEPFGNVHLEALASGVPMLTSARAGGAELVRCAENGWVIQDPFPVAIAAGLEALRSIDPARLRLAARASAEPFTYAAQVDRLREIYRGLRGGPESAGTRDLH
jgi:UDP-glucose:(heptosyl)LPS alpha-1,3-glucosyltransferase